jgi:hypothetical protein
VRQVCAKKRRAARTTAGDANRLSQTLTHASFVSLGPPVLLLASLLRASIDVGERAGSMI